ncbi:LmeA family phospholipid-binding protein [Rhodococcus hoagii]|nr:LmeA family phospholipid-binding protein [Prescottella equi]
MERKYDNVEIRAQQVEADMIGEVTIEASLNGVVVPASALLDGSVQTVPVDYLDGRMKIDATDLGKFLGIPDLQVFRSAGEQVRRHRWFRRIGFDHRRRRHRPHRHGSGRSAADHGECAGRPGTAGRAADDRGHRLQLRPRGRAEFTVPAPLRQQVLDRFTKTIDPQSLPFGIMPTEVYAQGSQIVVEGTGENLVINLDELQAQL